MLRIAVCDDEKEQLCRTAALIDAYLRCRPGMSGQVEMFSSGEALLARAETILGFDLCVLDILMPGINGIDAGRRLRTLGGGGEIIFLTSSNDFAADSYDVRAFFYLLKPVDEQKFFHVLDEAVEKLAQRRNDAVVVATAEGVRRVPLESILYVERVGRCARYFCTDGVVDSRTIRTSFRAMAAPLLCDRRFALCGASFVVNYQHVAGVMGPTALLDNGQVLLLPRSAAAEFKRAWGNYWLEEHSQ